MKALMWVYMVVIDAWRSREGQMRSPGFNLLRLFKAQFLDMEDWEDVEEVAHEFFWTRDMGSFVSNLWEDV